MDYTSTGEMKPYTLCCLAYFVAGCLEVVPCASKIMSCISQSSVDKLRTRDDNNIAKKDAKSCCLICMKAMFCEPCVTAQDLMDCEDGIIPKPVPNNMT